MMEARLVIDPSSISLQSSGPATGDIVLMVGDIAFPLAGWNDFVVVILEGWASALLHLLQGTSDGERVHFMEGPYAVDMSRLEGGAILLRALERPDREHALAMVRPVPLVESVVRAAEDVLGVCRDAHHRSLDVDQLELALGSLRQEASRLTS